MLDFFLGICFVTLRNLQKAPISGNKSVSQCQTSQHTYVFIVGEDCGYDQFKLHVYKLVEEIHQHIRP